MRAGRPAPVVGEPVTPAYRELLEGLAARVGGGRGDHLHRAVPQADLNAAYAAADALLTLSEHEGFCVPLLEAFHFGVPVVARPAGAMPEVAGDAVLWTDGGLAVTAELLDLAVRDGELRGELVRRGRARLETEFSYPRIAERVRDAVGALA